MNVQCRLDSSIIIYTRYSIVIGIGIGTISSNIAPIAAIKLTELSVGPTTTTCFVPSTIEAILLVLCEKNNMYVYICIYSDQYSR